MLNRIVSLLTITASLLCVSSVALASHANLQENRIDIVGGIGGRPALDIAAAIQKLADGKGKDINLFINSPGGDIVTGNMIVSAILLAKERGHKVVCATGALSASMAFTLLVNCSERYALPHARLLWHPGRAGGGLMPPLKAEDALLIKENLDRENKVILDNLLANLPASKEFVLKHFNEETLWDATALNEAMPGFVNIVDDIWGPANLFDVVGQQADGFSSPILKELGVETPKVQEAPKK